MEKIVIVPQIDRSVLLLLQYEKWTTSNEYKKSILFYQMWLDRYEIKKSICLRSRYDREAVTIR